MKKSKPPPAPDYAALATQQAALDKTAADQQTAINRPNQVTPWGNTSWAKDAAGNWTQNVSLNAADQSALDQERAFDSQKQGIASGLLGRAGETMGKPVNTSGLPEAQGFDMSKLGDFGEMDLSKLPELQGLDPSSLESLQGMDLSGMTKLDSGFGAVEGVRDAMMSRMAPQRQQFRDAEMQRLKSQGLPENSEAFQRAAKRIDEGDIDASQQALLGAMGASGDIFNRGLAANDQQLRTQMGIAGLRGDNRRQMFGEQESAARLSGDQRGQRFDEQNISAGLKNATRGQQFGEQDAAARMSGLLRQQGLSERESARQAPLNDFMKLTQGIDPSMPQMPSFMGGTGFNAADIAGAGQNQYKAQMDAYNAKQARKGGLMGGLFGLAGSALGGPIGGMVGKKVAGMFGG